MQLKYNEAAQDAGVYIVSACGFDSIPADLGMVFTQQKFGGEVNSTEIYLNAINFKDLNKPVANFATLESVLYGLDHRDKLRDIRKKMFSEKLPDLKPKLKIKLVELYNRCLNIL